ncbi:MAG: sodium-dependent transporter [Clostridia bacterium]|nr:sodium-dependent transporter [Clostridia bacterium]
MGERARWSSRVTFILAAIGSAVGLGNAWRFPGLAAKHGVGTFLVVYLFAMLVMGIPLLMMEIGIARNFRKGAVESMRGIKKGLEPVGWAATSNAFVIVCYYAVVFAWVILMFFNSWQFAGMTGESKQASNLFFELTQTTGAIEGSAIPGGVFVCLLVAWGLIFFCIRNGANSVGKVVKYTVFAPVILLLVMAVRGCTMPGAGDGLAMLFVPDWSALLDPTLWVDAIGQVFYSLSIMMAIMFAYGSYLGDDANIAKDAMIIAFSDMAVSVLSAVVMFSTMGGTGMLGNITASGIGTAFIVYPQAIVNLTDVGWFNALFGAVFYLMLITLAIDSAFSIVEGVSAAVADKFHLKPKTVTISICAIAGVISVLFVTEAGLAWLDIVDNWANNFKLILIGVLECIAVGWCFRLRKVLDEINKNTKRFRMPRFWFYASVEFVAPVLLIALFGWNMFALFQDAGGSYGGYPIWAQLVAGWAVSVLVFLSGFVAKFIVWRLKKKGYTEDEVTWREN